MSFASRYTYPKGLVMPGKDGRGQIVEASATHLTQIALTVRLRVVATLFGDLWAVTGRTANAVWPAQGTDGFKAFAVVNE
jgi:hypothetical protein